MINKFTNIILDRI